VRLSSFDDSHARTAVCWADDVPASERALSEMRALAGVASAHDEVGDPALEWLMCQTDASILTLRERRDEAEAMAQGATESRQPDAGHVYIGQLGMIRLHQGRFGELEGLFRQAAASSPEIPAYAVAHAVGHRGPASRRGASDREARRRR